MNVSSRTSDGKVRRSRMDRSVEAPQLTKELRSAVAAQVCNSLSSFYGRASPVWGVITDPDPIRQGQEKTAVDSSLVVGRGSIQITVASSRMKLNMSPPDRKQPVVP